MLKVSENLTSRRASEESFKSDEGDTSTMAGKTHRTVEEESLCLRLIHRAGGGLDIQCAKLRVLGILSRLSSVQLLLRDHGGSPRAASRNDRSLHH